MSHFSKIRTNISNRNILEKTIKDLGFYYNIDSVTNNYPNLYVYDAIDSSNHIFYFMWDNSRYILMADLMLWNLSVNFENFFEQLNQKYAYNLVLSYSKDNGFQAKNENLMQDGSIRLTVQKWLNI